MQKPLCGFTAHLLDFSTRPEQSLEFSEAAVKDLFEDVDKSSSSIQIWVCGNQVREGPKIGDCHEIVTKNGAKQAKTTLVQKARIQAIW